MPTLPSDRPSRTMPRVVNKATGFDAADRWDRDQHRKMSPQERQRAARALKDRAFPADAPDIRACRETAKHGRRD